MKKLLYILAGCAVVVALWFIFEYHPCKQPTEMQTALAQLNCAQSIPVQEFREHLCKEMRGTPECEFVPEDLPMIEELFMKEVNKCAIALLKKNNLCVDKYEAI